MDIIDIFLHLGDYLTQIIAIFGVWTYVILFLVIFAETGFVVTPFLPGDSLLFIVGAFAAIGHLNIVVVYVVLLAAAILGDTANYWLGNKLGAKVFSKENSKIFNKKYLLKTEAFYEKYGGKTIIIARFVPIVRTFAPFVAGIGKMRYSVFLTYNIIGACVWVTSLVLAGYFFGNLPIVKNNFEYAIYIIIFVSLLPMFFEVIKHKLQNKKTKEKATSYKEIKEAIKEVR
ncbi:MAG: DedA family protein [Candidatus Levybacteria bacterium]|nr:DedA family protein [Candidatus Levybacteria bacterium]